MIMDTFASTATSTFIGITGFSVEQLSAWATTTLKVFAGSAYSVIDMGQNWIIAAVIIGAVLYFSLAALYFFRY